MNERRHDYPDIVSRLNQLDAKVDLVLYGDPSGDTSRPGLMTRLDRLEQGSNDNRKIIGYVVTAIVALIGEAVHRWFFK